MDQLYVIIDYTILYTFILFYRHTINRGIFDTESETKNQLFATDLFMLD